MGIVLKADGKNYFESLKTMQYSWKRKRLKSFFLIRLHTKYQNVGLLSSYKEKNESDESSLCSSYVLRRAKDVESFWTTGQAGCRACHSSAEAHLSQRLQNGLRNKHHHGKLRNLHYEDLHYISIFKYRTTYLSVKFVLHYANHFLQNFQYYL